MFGLRHQADNRKHERLTYLKGDIMILSFRFALPIAVYALSGCSTAALPGQWSPTQVIGQDRYIIEGYETKDAIAGGTAYCTKMSKSFEAENVVPHTRTDRATITFRCK